ncbi:DUF1643 domain-containing protein [Corallococcus sp. CA054B]|uniref:DUF1643 domain-containing protein n=1 Tax=Corallococcus sp. CA054B TaxID=2316734 RepID=UPI000EA08E43|nr:DUF1643 domain-containing protein [Corallococcus sp. CA054B]RKG62909.1 DUF1643 domain-containing protein [Corallococcus sp. CA054B]
MTSRYLDAGAELSACGLYRYRLWRRWSAQDDRRVLFVMLNPSVADGQQDDPTLRRCVGFAQAWGYGALTLCNLFAFRATDPADLMRAKDAVGPLNDEALDAAAREASLVVGAWGAHRLVSQRAPAVLALLRRYHPVHALALTGAGEPRHPLYLTGHLRPQLYREALT